MKEMRSRKKNPARDTQTWSTHTHIQLSSRCRRSRETVRQCKARGEWIIARKKSAVCRHHSWPAASRAQKFEEGCVRAQCAHGCTRDATARRGPPPADRVCYVSSASTSRRVGRRQRMSRRTYTWTDTRANKPTLGWPGAWSRRPCSTLARCACHIRRQARDHGPASP